MSGPDLIGAGLAENDTRPTLVADRALDEAAWHAARAKGCTATDVAKLVAGGISTRKRIAKGKDEGGDFRGNRHTERGNRREVVIAEAVEREYGIHPSSASFAALDDPRAIATPDAINFDLVGGPVGAEIKSIMGEVKQGHVPRDFYDQMQWGMRVTGAKLWLYVPEPCDEHGQPISADPLEFAHWVERDDERIAQLEHAAQEFHAWRDAGMPDAVGELPEHVDEALTQWAHGAAIRDEGAEIVKASEEVIREYLKIAPEARDGLKASNALASINYTVKRGDKFDPALWARRAPRQAAQYAAAQERYTQPSESTRLSIAAVKAAA